MIFIIKVNMYSFLSIIFIHKLVIKYANLLVDILNIFYHLHINFYLLFINSYNF